MCIKISREFLCQTQSSDERNYPLYNLISTTILFFFIALRRQISRGFYLIDMRIQGMQWKRKTFQEKNVCEREENFCFLNIFSSLLSGSLSKAHFCCWAKQKRWKKNFLSTRNVPSLASLVFNVMSKRLKAKLDKRQNNSRAQQFMMGIIEIYSR